MRSTLIFAASTLVGLVAAQIPAVCWNTCNAANNEADQVGWAEPLCYDAAFDADISDCLGCIQANGGLGPDGYTPYAALFQFIADVCY
jgi:hypothetical protein